MCVGRRAAAAADDVDEAALARTRADRARPRLRALVVSAEGVGQAGVRIGADERVGDARRAPRCGAHRARAQRAVEADGERLRVAHRVPERLGVWPDSVRPERSVMVPEIMIGSVTPPSSNSLVACEDRRLGVQRVEDGLDQEEVGAALEQAARLLAVGVAQLVEGDGAGARIVDVGRHRGGAVGRPDRAGDEARLAVALARPRSPRAARGARRRELSSWTSPACRSRPGRSTSR